MACLYCCLSRVRGRQQPAGNPRFSRGEARSRVTRAIVLEMPSAVPSPALSHAIRETLESGARWSEGPRHWSWEPQGSLGSQERRDSQKGNVLMAGPGCSPHSRPGHLNRRGRAQRAGAAPFLAPLSVSLEARRRVLRLKSEEEEGDMCRGVGRTCQERGGDDNFSHLNYLFVEGKSPEYIQSCCTSDWPVYVLNVRTV